MMTKRLDRPVDPTRDHVLGNPKAQMTLLEYGSYSCPSCHAAHEVIADLRDRFGDQMRYVFRQRPIANSDTAVASAELAEYAGEVSDDFWSVHSALMERGPHFQPGDLEEISTRFELPPADERPEAMARAKERVRDDHSGAGRSGVMVSPTFFINGRRYDGPWDETSLADAMVGSLGHRIATAALDFGRWGPSTGLLLLVMTVAAVVATNSPISSAFLGFWQTPLGIDFAQTSFRLPLLQWVNDGLLSIFFLVVGLEIKREFTVGHLATRRAAALPIAAAVGGMTLPALLYVALAPEALAHGWGIPIATDTAFAVAIIVVLGDRVPVELRVFLTAAVIVDDLAAIVVVALFYSTGIDMQALLASGGVVVMLALLNRQGIYSPLPYALLGLVLWFLLHEAGIHATLAGVILAVFTPTRPPANLRALTSQAATILQAEFDRATERVLQHGPSEPAMRAIDAIHDRIESPANKLLRNAEPWSSYFVLPIFALANAGVVVSTSVIDSHISLMAAITCGLWLGKPLGMLLFARLATVIGLAEKPGEYTWRQLLGAGALGGFGFTMSLFIASQAFPDPADFAAAKIAVFGASFLAGATGALILWRRPKLSASSEHNNHEE